MAYHPLDSTAGDIRLLYLLPSVDGEGDIQCKLEHRSLDKNATYSALSYVWGNPEPAKAITLNGNPQSVTPNLFAALRRLRHTTETMCLWIDALCINQGDNQERSSQVEQMGKIYETAEVVLMWLGEEENNSNLAMELIQLLYTTVRKEGRAVFEPERFDRLKDLLSNISFEQHWLALGHLFKRPYWSRVWIIQEVLLTNHALLSCGVSKSNWDNLMQILYLLSKSSFSYLLPAAKDILLNPASLPISLATMHARRTMGERMSFLDGLVLYRNRLATDPRDHVYAILSLVEHSDFKPDYNKPLFTLYREVAKFMIKMHESLDILSACKKAQLRTFSLHTAVLSLTESLGKGVEAARSEETEAQSDSEEGIRELENINKSLQEKYLPSWVPDWRDWVNESGYLLLDYSDKCYSEAGGNPQPQVDFLDDEHNLNKCYYEAGGRTKPKVHFPEDERLLVADGIRVDSIKVVSSKMTGSGSMSPAIKGGWDLWHLGDHPTHLYGDRKQQEAAFLQTIVTGRNLDGSKGNRHLSANSANAMFELGLTDDGQQEGDQHPTEREYMSISLMNPWFGFCITSQGFMGRVPHGTQPGDVVAVFLGAKVPFVLRKHRSEDRYFFVGECYIHGIMEGEVMNGLEKGEQDLEKFCLM
ncbi:heterokaryon incompatibility protein-domain-containing protein [Bisporella sp. PMI_857]|nr:heterokaryon incompatibility protein-domain-containing protein [Bisporella sp. PMI_857]